MISKVSQLGTKGISVALAQCTVVSPTGQLVIPSKKPVQEIDLQRGVERPAQLSSHLGCTGRRNGVGDVRVRLQSPVSVR